MSPELSRSDDRGGELATTRPTAQPADGPETAQHQPAGDAGQPADDSGQDPAESDQGVGEADHAARQSGALAATQAATEPATVPEPGQVAGRERDAAGVQAFEPAADQTDGALLADAARLHAGWQRIQAGFVDDPREAVADAADLVEHTAQAFTGALQQRQRRLRGIWDGDRRPDGAAEQMTDTEQLRLVMQRYRSLFDQLCRP
jgi:PAS domain-containing protein